ncbi:MAG: Xaa-Pro peptidase family protein [Candidatus Omnitrophica bacterium]|nr:Xaa-Pro peptidase family protein [Candidatus Omnitrophota bacterium]
MTLQIQNIRKKIAQKKIDCLLVTSATNISYLTQTPSRDSYFLISKNRLFYLTDSRYTEEAKKRLGREIIIKKIDGAITQTLVEICLEINAKRIGFEERNLSFSGYKKIKTAFGKKVSLIPTQDLVENLREVKSVEELKKIRKAIAITKEALNFAKRVIKPGKKELEVVAELERFIRYHGAKASAFDIIVASGANSSFPHHISSQKRIRNNELVLVDIGVDYEGYKSDLTRIFFLGRISVYARSIYDLVLKANRSAINAIKPGTLIAKIDSQARSTISQKGFGEYFGHSLGHGVGLDIHEKPTISGKNQEKLTPGMVFTVEPAIYLPGKFGIRIEDMVLVTKKGCEVLSGSIN